MTDKLPSPPKTIPVLRGLAIALAAANIILIEVILHYAPDVPDFPPVHGVSLVAVDSSLPALDLIKRELARRYAHVLFGPAEMDQFNRIRQAENYSDPKFWKTAGKAWIERIDSNFGPIRSSHVNAVDLMSEDPAVARYAIDVIIVRRRDGEEDSTTNFRAVIAARVGSSSVQSDDLPHNPVGFRVINFWAAKPTN